MGRPLKRETIVKMDLTASGKKLGKQVGYNKYLVQKDALEDTDEIVMLAKEEDLEKGHVKLMIGDNVVLKLVRNLIQTEDGVIPYVLDEDGKIVINGEKVPSLPEEDGEEDTDSEQEDATVVEPVVESIVEPVAEPVAKPVVVKATTKKSSKK